MRQFENVDEIEGDLLEDFVLSATEVCLACCLLYCIAVGLSSRRMYRILLEFSEFCPCIAQMGMSCVRKILVQKCKASSWNTKLCTRLTGSNYRLQSMLCILYGSSPCQRC